MSHGTAGAPATPTPGYRRQYVSLLSVLPPGGAAGTRPQRSHAPEPVRRVPGSHPARANRDRKRPAPPAWPCRKSAQAGGSRSPPRSPARPAPGLPQPPVNPANIVGGGPPPDGIPAIGQPRFLRAAQVNFLSASEPVLALQIGADARAYLVQILIWHEIVNDTVGGVPVAVTYCPLCNSAIAYDRRVAGRVLSFGTSGRLYDSNLVMYDRQTQSLWVQFTG